MFEIFVKAHLLFALALAGILWFHVPLTNNRFFVCLGIASALWATQHVMWLCRLIYRNSAGSDGTITLLRYRNSIGSTQCMKVTIRAKRPWNVQPGQYAYVTVPSIAKRRAAFIQTHPYVIAWVDKANSEITLLIQRNKGFSSDFLDCSHTDPSVIVDGPYGHARSLDSYDTVLFLCSGIGIAAHLLSIKHLLEAHENKSARVRRLSLVWFLETLGMYPLHDEVEVNKGQNKSIGLSRFSTIYTKWTAVKSFY